MSDDLVGRYRRVYVRIWDDPKFRKLSPNEQRFALYVLSGPQSNRIGLFRFSIPRAAEDLNLGIETLRKALTAVCTAFGWLFDAEARVMYLPSWWRWNLSVNANIFRGNLKDLSEIPSCAFVDAFARNTAYLPPNLVEIFVEALRTRLPKASRTSEAVPVAGTGRQEQESTALRAVPLRRHSKSQKPQLEETPSNGATSPLVAIARQTLNLAGRNQPIDELLDAFWCVRGSSDGCSRAEALEALNVALAERRQPA